MLKLSQQVWGHFEIIEVNIFAQLFALIELFMASGGERENITSENSLMPPLAIFTLALACSLNLQCVYHM